MTPDEVAWLQSHRRAALRALRAHPGRQRRGLLALAGACRTIPATAGAGRRGGAPMTALNGQPVPHQHTEPRYVVTAQHDGSVELRSCLLCQDPEALVTVLLRVAAAIEAQTVTPPGDGT